MKLKSFLGLIIKIMWSELHSYKGAEKLSNASALPLTPSPRL